ncbi:winged helix-turn-helix domain-containing protein [Streptomyces sp. NPDC059165]|uniref:winged helix-turn-helix domain-containing protein n=1 Tax=Streptomyces sp. NPDC059165 TaxID=3346751 RepID=UPI003689530C
MTSQSGEPAATLRELAHPLRLRILSPPADAQISAAVIPRESAISHANASYHLRQLHGADLIDVIGEERIRGGAAKRYRRNREQPRGIPSGTAHNTTRLRGGAEITDAFQLVYATVAIEPQRRADACKPGPTQLADAGLWTDPAQWDEASRVIGAASKQLELAARLPCTPGSVRAGATDALFPVESDR